MSSAQNSNVLRPKDLTIAWGEDTRYWRLPTNEGEPAELLKVIWLEVKGSRRVEAGKTYEVGFQVSLTENASGWSDNPVYIKAKIGEKGKDTMRRAALDKLGTQPVEIPEQPFTITAPQDDTLYFGMYEVWDEGWKRGLRIHGAFVREAI